MLRDRTSCLIFGFRKRHFIQAWTDAKLNKQNKSIYHIFFFFRYNSQNINNFLWYHTTRCFTKLMQAGVVLSRSSRPELFSKKVFLRILQNWQEKTCVVVSFLKKLHALNVQVYWKGDSGTDLFVWILQKVYEYLCYNTSSGCIWVSSNRNIRF